MSGRSIVYELDNPIVADGKTITTITLRPPRHDLFPAISDLNILAGTVAPPAQVRRIIKLITTLDDDAVIDKISRRNLARIARLYHKTLIDQTFTRRAAKNLRTEKG